MTSFKTALRMFFLMTLLTGIIYPLLVTLIAQFTMPSLSNGSLIIKEGLPIGSLLIAQKMTDNRYFFPRPSAIDYNPLSPSGGSNLGPTSLKLKSLVNERRQKLGEHAPSDLLYASGSGLDPHISLKAAYFQIPRIAKARSLDEKYLRQMIDSHAERTFLGILAPQYVNVLILNQALDHGHE